MFREWGFLLSEMMGLIVLAALLGLFVGWLIWAGRGKVKVIEADPEVESERDRLRVDLEICRRQHEEKDTQLASLREERDAARKVAATAAASVPAAGRAVVEMERAAALKAPAPAPAAEPAPVADPEPTPDFDGDGLREGTDEGIKPSTLEAARDGQPDDLKQIKGIGPKLEQLCNRLGFYHFDQIAAWSADEVAWVDANLEGFKGRVSRDGWVEQAKVLAEGGETEFAKRVKDGDVY
ncbi:hypothetical protein VK792_02175 [Mesobacterium sp. TK19101]|uniref:Uncharacterized protein n=1 Tax=Mesobacterium hydrothermale TaxID=3111907 RepID=A0ABU6HDY6_9RHOB|nr:hypothetical protein [Mesobacterium sp. TK19101]MEC3860080.1 hypothetical protein [Mesobacterium sp. TK19101]